MAKEISCKVLKVYCQTDETEYGDTRLCEVSWNNRPCKGVDIRKYDKGRDGLSKGITISYSGFTEIVQSAIENSLIDIEKVEQSLNRRKQNVFSDDDFSALFQKMNKEAEMYERDKYGFLRDKKGYHVITSRRKGLR